MRRSPFTVPSASGCAFAKTLVRNRKSGPRRSSAAAIVKFFIFDAGIKYLSASFSNMTLPELSETILIPTRPRRTSDESIRWRIFDWRSSSVCVLIGIGVGVGATAEVGFGTGLTCGVGDGATLVAEFAELSPAMPSETKAETRTSDRTRISRIFFIWIILCQMRCQSKRQHQPKSLLP